MFEVRKLGTLSRLWESSWPGKVVQITKHEKPWKETEKASRLKHKRGKITVTTASFHVVIRKKFPRKAPDVTRHDFSFLPLARFSFLSSSVTNDATNSARQHREVCSDANKLIIMCDAIAWVLVKQAFYAPQRCLESLFIELLWFAVSDFNMNNEELWALLLACSREMTNKQRATMLRHLRTQTGGKKLENYLSFSALFPFSRRELFYLWQNI